MIIIKDLLSIQQISSESLKEIHGGFEPYGDVDVDVEIEIEFEQEGFSIDDLEWDWDSDSGAPGIEIELYPSEGLVVTGFGWPGMTESDFHITVVGDSNNVYPGGSLMGGVS
ncbi:MAG: hypothetical protein QNJ51_11720 [Calothrix sp. MO_167.B12]|nr:hypothetical protein [Calothrix sp. MO_167.B12]